MMDIRGRKAKEVNACPMSCKCMQTPVRFSWYEQKDLYGNTCYVWECYYCGRISYEVKGKQ